MSDRKLLKFAAKAAGIESSIGLLPKDGVSIIQPNGQKWNPLADDGDALRLAVKLGLVCGFVQPNCWAELPGQYPSYEPCEPDPLAATRRAIVRAAAEIGRKMT